MNLDIWSLVTNTILINIFDSRAPNLFLFYLYLHLVSNISYMYNLRSNDWILQCLCIARL